MYPRPQFSDSPVRLRPCRAGYTAVALLILLLGIRGDPGILSAANAQTTNASLGVGRPFSFRQEDDRLWLIRPDGKRFFSLGICCVNQGASRAEFDAANPAYAAWQHYADSNAWAGATVRRIKSWGFTTVGGWSDFHA